MEACENQEWSLLLKNVVTGRLFAVPYKCRSWRHPGNCQRWKNAYDFVRIKRAVEKMRYLLYLVLTLPSAEHVKLGNNPYNAFTSLRKKWDVLRKIFYREFGKCIYIELVEQHKDMTPHINLIIENKKMYNEFQTNYKQSIEKLRLFCVRAGFGQRVYCEPVNSKEAIAGYFVKLCSEAVKVNQAPVDAPKHFRRLRTSKGLLEKRHKNSNLTGSLQLVDVLTLQKWIEWLELERKKNENVLLTMETRELTFQKRIIHLWQS